MGNLYYIIFMQVLVFSEKKAEVDDIHEYLLLKGVEAVSIHGGKGCLYCFMILQCFAPLPWNVCF